MRHMLSTLALFISLGGSLALAVHFVRWHEETRRELPPQRDSTP
jgi:hypothetical protein